MTKCVCVYVIVVVVVVVCVWCVCVCSESHKELGKLQRGGSLIKTYMNSWMYHEMPFHG